MADTGIYDTWGGELKYLSQDTIDSLNSITGQSTAYLNEVKNKMLATRNKVSTELAKIDAKINEIENTINTINNTLENAVPEGTVRARLHMVVGSNKADYINKISQAVGDWATADEEANPMAGIVISLTDMNLVDAVVNSIKPAIESMWTNYQDTLNEGGNIL